MTLLEFNLYWMVYNINLAIIAIVCGWLAIKIKHPIIKITLLILWLLFVPNTLYLLSDSIHFSDQLSNLHANDRIILALQYITLMIFGIISYIISMYPIDKLIKKTHFLILLQFVIAFGIIMGRLERTNSWEVFTDPVKVYNDAITTLISIRHMYLVLITGIAGNGIYFLFKSIFTRYVVRK